MGYQLAVTLASVLTIALMAAVRSQGLPENACAQYFQYLNNGGGYEGELTLPRFQQGRNRIDLRFSQEGKENSAAIGDIHPYPDEEAVRSSAGTVKFRISLWPGQSNGLLPKLALVKYNDATVCSASEYGGSNTHFNRFYELEINGGGGFVQFSPQFTQPSNVFQSLPEDQANVIVKTILYESPVTSRQPWTSSRAPNTWQSWTPSTAKRLPDPFVWPPPTAKPSPDPSVLWQTPASPPAAQPDSVFRRISSSRKVECGIEGLEIPLIHNGHRFPRDKYPWLTALYHKEGRGLMLKCGSSLISATMVITAAHCVHSIKEEQVILGVGRYDLEDYEEHGFKFHKVKRILSHPEFTTRRLPDADLALLTMEQPAEFSDVVSPICLWEESESHTVVTEGTVAGWGLDQHNVMTQFPHEITSEIASATDCARAWRENKTSDRTLCAGNRDGSGPCMGDSGGGLMVKRHNRWLLRGIVSLGERATTGGCNLNKYVLYCDVSKHLSWINANLY